VEPFVPVTVEDDAGNLLGGQVFLLRHVQIDKEHFLQGFKLNELRLLELVERSARRVLPQGMDFLLSRAADEKAAYTAVMDFGFGEMVLNLFEANPAWIVHKVHWLRRWYMGTVAVVMLAVGLGLIGLWQGTTEQVRLARKKDDFISAVSHELRTPLTSVRMYSEMLEKGWVDSREKQKRYYQNMRQETERLSRLVDNVLDFSRIQRGRKQYHFEAGDLNACITQVVNMMRPFARQHGFVIETDLTACQEMCFDRDAVTQIVVNLLDNAIKYARQAEDKTIQVRTQSEGAYLVIEVEDHGPGVPHTQRKRIFEQFYRTESESTRQTTGTGLGLALVKEFAEAHQGFVQVAAAKPTGAVFRVGLAIRGQVNG
jgi:signal transduction histidine kinase